MPKQLSLFDDSGAPRHDRTYGLPMPAECPLCDHTVAEEEKPRLQGECAEILELLQSKARVTNKEMAAISLKYTSRVSDLRKAGHVIKCVDRDHQTGECGYELEE